MAKFSLCIAANYLHLVGQRQPLLLLFLRARSFNSCERNYPMKICKSRLIYIDPKFSCLFLCKTEFNDPFPCISCLP
nr:hypothetical protein Iba_chr15bCG1250 [Ipomoea batatas]